MTDRRRVFAATASGATLGRRPTTRPRSLAVLAIVLGVQGAVIALPGEAVAQAQPPARANAAPRQGGALGAFGDNSQGPIRIDAARLEVFDKEQRAVYSGDVVVVRGVTTIRTPELTIFYENRQGGNNPSAQPAAARGGTSTSGQDGSIRRILMKGPVSVVSGTQTATANEMIYDAVARKVFLRGNAVIADGDNVQRGENMEYNMDTGIATVTGAGAGGRVQGVFTPGSEPGAGAGNRGGASPQRQR